MFMVYFSRKRYTGGGAGEVVVFLHYRLELAIDMVGKLGVGGGRSTTAVHRIETTATVP